MTALAPTLSASFSANSPGSPTWQTHPLSGPLTPLLASADRPHHLDGPPPLTDWPLVVKLPTTTVSIKIALGMPATYLNSTIASVPAGNDVQNKSYPGWCGDYYHYITIGVWYTATLYSTYDNALPSYLAHQNWSKVNYVVNHKVGTDYLQIQCAIWYLLDCGNLGLNTQGWQMVNDAKANGTNYVPSIGQKCLVLLGVSPTVQRTLIELTIPARILTTHTDGQGTISKSPDLTGYVYGQKVNLTASPTIGWTFDHWSGDATGGTNPVTVTMNGNKTVTATFTQNHYTLSLSVSPANTGTITPSPAQPNNQYHYGDIVSLAATANPGYSFNSWTGDANGTTTPVSITINADKAVTATFTQNHYSLTTLDNGSGGITKTPDQASYTYGQTVQLTATPTLGWSFDHWAGDATGTTSTVNVTIDAPKTVTAYYTQNHYTLDTAVIGSGTITKDPDASYYLYGQIVQLTALPAPGWSFDHWSGDATGTTNPVDITVTSGIALTAHFTQNHYSLTLTNDGNGTITRDPDQPFYLYGQTIQLTAQADPGWTFDHWSGDASGTSLSVDVTIDGPEAITAHYTQNHYTIGVSIVGSGAVQKDPDTTDYLYGQVVHLTALPALGWSFDHWSGDASGTTTTVDVTTTDNKAVTATFTQNHYTLTLSTDGSGSVAKDPDASYYLYGQTVQLTAQPALGWSFDHWSGDADSNTPTISITMTSNQAVTAHFTQDQYLLTISTDGSGSVLTDPDQSTYTYGQTVQLTAQADPGWTFDHWTGDGATGTTNPVTITLQGNTAVTAHFTQNHYTLTVSTDGSGSVLKDPDQTTYTYGQTVTLTAQPTIGWSFDHWSGDATGNANEVDITILGDQTVTAHFTQNHYSLTISTDGSGTVSKDPDQTMYTYGQTIQLTAQPALGWTFDHWTGDVTGTTNPASVTIDGNKAVTATFTQNHYTLTISTDGSGSVQQNPDQTTYTYGQVVTLTANPEQGWTFNYWSGDATGSTNPTTVTIDDNKAVTAHFSQNQYSLSISTDGTGTVSKDPDQNTYTYGQVVTLTATAGQGWTFDHWSGDATGSTNPVTVTMNGNKAVTAHFTQNHYSLTISTDGSGTVSKDPDQTTYTYGQVVTLTANPEQGWSFDHWSGDASGSSNPTTVTMNGDKSVTAHFTQNQYTLTLTYDGSGTVTKDPDQTTYTYGQVVTLTASPEQGWSFDHWSGDASGSSNPTTVTIDANKAVTAHFTQNQYTLTVSTDGSGTVVKNPDQATYTYGQAVQLTAQPAANWSFDHWSGDVTGSTNPTSITMTADAAVTAHFSHGDLLPPIVKIWTPGLFIYLRNKPVCPFFIPMFFGNVTVTVNASDNQSGIDHVQILVDNVLKATLTTPPYRWTWVESKPMKHTLTAVAYDKAGNHAMDSELVLRWRFHPVLIGLIVLQQVISWRMQHPPHQAASTPPSQ